MRHNRSTVGTTIYIPRVQDFDSRFQETITGAAINRK
jgi:hypothetical protein